MLTQFGFILKQQIKQKKFKIDIRLVNEKKAKKSNIWLSYVYNLSENVFQIRIHGWG